MGGWSRIRVMGRPSLSALYKPCGRGVSLPLPLSAAWALPVGFAFACLFLVVNRFAGSSPALVSIMILGVFNSKFSAFLKRGFSGVVSMFIHSLGGVNFAGACVPC